MLFSGRVLAWWVQGPGLKNGQYRAGVGDGQGSQGYREDTLCSFNQQLSHISVCIPSQGRHAPPAAFTIKVITFMDAGPVTAARSLCYHLHLPGALVEGQTDILVFFLQGVKHTTFRWPQLTRGLSVYASANLVWSEFCLLQPFPARDRTQIRQVENMKSIFFNKVFLYMAPSLVWNPLCSPGWTWP